MSHHQSTKSLSLSALRLCSIEGCERHVHGHGFCKMHHKRWRKYGDPLGKALPKPQPSQEVLIERFYSHTQRVGACLLWIGARNTSGYGTLVIAGKSWVAHRWIYTQTYGPFPDDVALCQSCHHPACVELGHLSPKPEPTLRTWSEAEIELVRQAYAPDRQAPIDLIALAKQIPRHTKAHICRKAHSLGLTNPRRFKIAGGQQPRPRKYATEEERRREQGEAMRTLIAQHGHPRRFLGHTHSAAARARISQANRQAWSNPDSKFFTADLRQQRSDNALLLHLTGKVPEPYTRTSGGRRADLGDQYFRSAWEANYARFLNWLQARKEILKWEYEPKTFIFEAIQRGTRSYTPDFKVSFPDKHYEWHEVKGWMDPQSQTRLARMAKYFPEEPIVLIDQTWFRQAQRSGLDGLIPGWERKKR